jgi:hypothetical protein
VFDELVGDMVRRGFRSQFPIITHNGKIIAGVHRARACVKAGVDPVYQQFDGKQEDVERFIIQADLCRRHLKPEQRRDELKKLLKKNPEQSDRTIAAMAGVSPTTVGSARRELGSNVQVGHKGRVEKSGRRARGRKPGSAGPAEPNNPPEAMPPEVIEKPTGGAPESVKESPEELPACAAGAWWEQDDQAIAQSMASHMSRNRIWEIAGLASKLKDQIEPLVVVVEEENDYPPAPRRRRPNAQDRGNLLG